MINKYLLRLKGGVKLFCFVFFQVEIYFCLYPGAVPCTSLGSMSLNNNKDSLILIGIFPSVEQLALKAH